MSRPIHLLLYPHPNTNSLILFESISKHENIKGQVERCQDDHESYCEFECIIKHRRDFCNTSEMFNTFIDQIKENAPGRNIYYQAGYAIEVGH